MINAIRIVELNREWILGCMNMEFISRGKDVTRSHIIFVFIIYYEFLPTTELLPTTALNPVCCLVIIINNRTSAIITFHNGGFANKTDHILTLYNDHNIICQFITV